MEIRELKYFLAIASEKSITRAAESVHIAQPSLSKQMIDLENKLGKKLFIRGKKEIVLTEEGLLLRKRAEEIINLLEKTQKEISSDEKMIGDIFLGGSIPKSVIAKIVKLREEYPDIKFHFYSGDAIDVSERLDHGSLDFAIMLEPIDNNKYDFISLNEYSRWGIIVKSEDELTKKKFIEREDLIKLPLIMHQRVGLQNQIAHWAKTNLEDLNIVATYNVIGNSPIQLVKQGLGYFLTTNDLFDSYAGESISFIPLEPAIPTSLALVWKKHIKFSAIAKAFKDIIN